MRKYVEIEFLDIEENKRYEELINKVLEKCFQIENLEYIRLYVSVILTTPAQIKKFNNEYRGIDKETDVLSFPMFERNEICQLKSNVKNNVKNNVKSNIDSNIKSDIDSNVKSNIDSDEKSNINSNIKSNTNSSVNINVISNMKINQKSSLKNNQENFEEVLGDIIISIERVKEQAEEYGHSFERELSYMIVHGFYHLMGEDHIEEGDKKRMREKEENVLNLLNIMR